MKQNKSVNPGKGVFITYIIFYLLIAFEFFYMASPFAVYFYGIYGPGLKFANNIRNFSFLTSTFLPHITAETSSLLLNSIKPIGAILAVTGFIFFCICATHVYYYKLAKKGAVTGGIYKYIRHPQYLSFAICSFGLLLLWPRFIVLIMFITMLFAYFLLARLEEQECIDKFGESYIEYMRGTNMFFPFIKITGKKILPRSKILKTVLTCAIYTLIVYISVISAKQIQYYSLEKLYSVYQKNAAYISLIKIDNKKLKNIISIIEKEPTLEKKLTGPDKFLNYILPVTWFVSEIPMKKPEEYGSCSSPTLTNPHSNPLNYSKTLYKIIFTKTELNDKNAEGKYIAASVIKRIPVAEVIVDLSKNEISKIEGPSSEYMYGSIPMPVF